MFLSMSKTYLDFNIVSGVKMYYNVTKKIALDCNVLELFYPSLYTDYFSNLYQKFQVAFTYVTNIKCHICSCCYNKFLRYADKQQNSGLKK